MTKPRVILCDDHQLLLAALVKLLEQECDVVGVAPTGKALIELAGRLHPDLALVDLSLPDMSGLDAVRILRQQHPDLKVVICTMHEQPELAAEALHRGAAAYVLKRSSAADMFQALRAALAGQRFISEPLARKVLALSGTPNPADRRSLTERQRDILRLLAEGRPMKQVAAILGVSRKTVEYHKYLVMRQLHLQSSAELIQYAVREHLVQPGAQLPQSAGPP